MLVLVLLFVLLSPGVLVTLPPVGGSVFMSGKTSLVAVLVHAAVFAVVLYILSDMDTGTDTDGFRAGNRGRTTFINNFARSTFTGWRR
jgi:hypothetical protein